MRVKQTGVQVRRHWRRLLTPLLAVVVALGSGVLIAACGNSDSSSGDGSTIKIGTLIPVTGLETHNGAAMKYGAEIGADEINSDGGIAGGQVELLTEDSGADVNQAVQKTQQLMTQDNVDMINGTLLSNVRAAVFDVAKQDDLLYMNPTFFEGGLCSPNFFSTGAPPNQTIDPLARYAMEKLGKSVYFIGSDYIWGTGSVDAATAAVTEAGGTVAGDPQFVPLGTTDFSAEIRKIQAAKPDIVWPFVAGQDGITFLKQLTDAGIRDDVEIIADYIDELIVPALSPETYEGIVDSSTYFMSLDNPENQAFLDTLRSKYGNDALISSFGINMYNNMKLLQVSARDLDSWDQSQVISNLTNAEFTGPSGRVAIDPANQYATQEVYIAEIQKDGTFKVVSQESDVPAEAGCTVE